MYIHESLFYQPCIWFLHRIEDLLYLGRKVPPGRSDADDSNVLMSIFATFFIPETKDRALEEIDEMFIAGLPAWKFASYVCTGVGAHHGAGNNQQRLGPPKLNDEKEIQVESNGFVTPTEA